MAPRRAAQIVSLQRIMRPAHREFLDVYFVTDLMETDLACVIRSQQTLLDDHVQFFVYQACPQRDWPQHTILGRVAPATLTLPARVVCPGAMAAEGVCERVGVFACVRVHVRVGV